MKKIFTLLLVAMLLTPAAAMAFTEEEIADTDTGETISVLSNNVTLLHTGNAMTYAAISGHLNGSKIYGSSSEDTKIYSQVSDPVDVVAPTDSDSGDFQTGWTAL